MLFDGKLSFFVAGIREINAVAPRGVLAVRAYEIEVNLGAGCGFALARFWRAELRMNLQPVRTDPNRSEPRTRAPAKQLQREFLLWNVCPHLLVRTAQTKSGLAAA